MRKTLFISLKNNNFKLLSDTPVSPVGTPKSPDLPLSSASSSNSNEIQLSVSDLLTFSPFIFADFRYRKPFFQKSGFPIRKQVIFPGFYSKKERRTIKKEAANGSLFHLLTRFYGYIKLNVQVTPAITIATILISLIKILRLGPEVSLNGSPTVSPITVAL